jgi:hypothetical protein
MDEEIYMVKLNSLSWKLRSCWYAMRRWWSRVRHGITIGFDGSMLPSLGKGKFVDVLRRGDCIEIRDHHTSSPYVIRLIPYQPNHGVMVEYVDSNGKVGWRTHCDAIAFCKMGFGSMEAQTQPTTAPCCTVEDAIP